MLLLCLLSHGFGCWKKSTSFILGADAATVGVVAAAAVGVVAVVLLFLSLSFCLVFVAGVVFHR